MKKIENLCWNNDFLGSKLFNVSRKTGKSPPPSRNPFLNFLRDFRKCNTGIGSNQLMKKGGEIWRKMSQAQKLLYFELAKSAPKRKLRGSRKRKRIRGRRRKRSRARRSRAKSRRRSHRSEESEISDRSEDRSDQSN
ncbi:HMG box and/or DUF1074 domain containing protein [Asbolus verrucosus]|uniref:HMG box and/or DUF1074 domain containing protein n=1 Tax=Asbolus verrucosus TaxID=1661398 RepID=A0A482W0F1_ASBVE|nr:HMG box and/or DUF1074 domain containing protein [Asbolus verrucosus]